MLSDIDWPCQVHRRFSETNLGCEQSIETGLDWAFGLVDRAIVLEDDCLPDVTFFPYAAELLERYRDDQRVWHIAGNQHGVPDALFDGRSYAFSTWASVWGWATWADRWHDAPRAFPTDRRRLTGAHPTGDAAARHPDHPISPTDILPRLPLPTTL